MQFGIAVPQGETIPVCHTVTKVTSMDITQDAAAEQSKNTETTTEVVNPVVTMGDMLAPKEAPRMVPEAALLAQKAANKDLKRDMAVLKSSIESGASTREVSTDIKTLADKHGVDAEFLQEFSAAVRKQAEDELEGKLASKLKPLEEKEEATRRDSVFSEHFDKTLESMPEYKGVVNKDVIKTLSLDPKNANKTFAQILESAYGHLITGKRSIDTAKPRGGSAPVVDIERASKDSEAFAEVMADPASRAEYNKGLENRLKL